MNLVNLFHARGRRAAFAVGLAGLLVVGSVTIVAAAGQSGPLPGSGAAVCLDARAAARQHPSVDTLRTLGECEIDRRLATLAALDTRVGGSATITVEHKVQLREANGLNPASFAAETAGLAELRGQIVAETDLSKLKAEIGQIAPDFRVYLLVVPKTRLVGAADAAGAAVGRLTTVSSRLQAAIDKAKAGGRDVTAAQAALDDLKAKTDQASGLVAPLAATLMPLSPSDWNSGAAKPALTAARTAIQQARGLLKAARADAAQVVSLLR